MSASPFPLWNVPHLRNPNFTGRTDHLRRLRHALATGRRAALTQSAAIHGLGGVGKTQLAVEFAYREQQDYAVVWWLRAEDPTTLAADFAALADALALPATGDPADAARAWLATTDHPWLLIFDNAPSPAALAPVLPRRGAGHLITT